MWLVQAMRRHVKQGIPVGGCDCPHPGRHRSGWKQQPEQLAVILHSPRGDWAASVTQVQKNATREKIAVLLPFVCPACWSEAICGG